MDGFNVGSSLGVGVGQQADQLPGDQGIELGPEFASLFPTEQPEESSAPAPQAPVPQQSLADQAGGVIGASVGEDVTPPGGGIELGEGFAHLVQNDLLDSNNPLQGNQTAPAIMNYEAAASLVKKGKAPVTADPYTPPPAATPPRNEVLKFLSPNVYSGSISGLGDDALSATYSLAKRAEAAGYKLLITSGKRNGGGRSYHDHGEAVDGRIVKKNKDGTTSDLTPTQEVEVGKRLAAGTGFRSMLDEINYNLGGSGSHLHFAVGLERNLVNDPSHHDLGATPHAPAAKAQPHAPAAKAQPHAPAAKAQTPEAKAQRAKYVERGKVQGPANLLDRAEAWARAQGIDPVVFQSQIQAESEWNPNAVSPVGATGLGQMMPRTMAEVAKEAGVDPSMYAKDFNMQLHLAARYHRKMLDQNGGNVARTLAAYNAGPGGLQDIVKSGRVYPETSEYVFKILQRVDPSITNKDQTDQMILRGTGPVNDPHKEARDIAGTRQWGHDLVVDAFNAVSGDTGARTGNTYGEVMMDKKNPMSLPSQLQLHVLEILQDSPLGLLGMSKALAAHMGYGQMFEEAEATRASADKEIANNPLLRAAYSYGWGMPRMMAMMMTGGLITKALGMEAKVAGVIKGAAGAEGVASLMPPGVSRILTAKASEAAVTGGMWMGGQAAGDYLYNLRMKNGQFDPKEFLTHTLTGTGMGAGIGLGLAYAFPAAVGITGSFLQRMLGSSYNESAIGATLKSLEQLNPVGQVAAGTLAGGFVGGTATSMGEVTGINKALFGEGNEPTVWGGTMAGAALGGGTSLLGASGLWSAIHKRLSPEVLATAQKAAGVVDSWTKTLGDAWVHNTAADYMNWLKQGQELKAAAAADAVSGHVNSLLDHTEQHLAAQATSLEQPMAAKLAEINQLQQQAQGGQHILSEIGRVYPDIPGVVQSKMEAVGKLAKLQQEAGNNPTPAQGRTMAAFQKVIDKADELSKDKDPAKAKAFATFDSVSQKQLQASQTLGPKLDALKKEYSLMEGIHGVLTKDAPQAIAASRAGIQEAASKLKSTGSWEFAFPEQTPVWQAPPGAVDGAVYSAHQNALASTLTRAGQNQATDPGLFATEFLSKFLPDRVNKLVGGSPTEITDAVVKDLKDRLKGLRETEASPPEDLFISKPSSVRNNYKGSLMQYDLKSAPKSGGLVAMDAATLYKHAVDNGIDADAVNTAYTDLSQRLLREPGKVAPMVWDGKPSAEVAAAARVAMDHGEQYVPLHATNLSSLKDTAIGNWKEVQLAERGRIAREIEDMKSLNPMLQEVLVGDIPDADPNHPAAAGGNLSALSNQEQMIRGWEKRIGALEASVKEVLPKSLSQGFDALLNDFRGKGGKVAGDEVFTSGNVAEVLKMTPSKADMAARQYREALHLAELKRLQWFTQQPIARANPEGGLGIVQALREKWVNDIPDSQQVEVQTASQILSGGHHAHSFVGTDGEKIHEFNAMMADLAKGPDIAKRMYGVTFDGLQNVAIHRPMAVRYLTENVVRPAYDKMYDSMRTKFPELKKADQMSAFQLEMAKALENPGSMKTFREKWGKDNVDGMLDLFYRNRALIENIRAADPELRQLSKSLHFPHIFQRPLTHLEALKGNPIHYSVSEKVFSDIRSRFKSFEDVERGVAAEEGWLAKQNISEKAFLQLDPEERAQFVSVGVDNKEAWLKLDEKQRSKFREEAETRAQTLMLRDPKLHPADLLGNELMAVVKADSLRTITNALQRVVVPTDPGGVNQRGLVMEVSRSKTGGGAIAPEVHMQDLNTGEWLYDKAGNPVKGSYRFADEIPMLQGIKLTRPDGTQVPSRNVAIHPVIADMIGSYISAPVLKDASAPTRIFNRAMGIFRAQLLAGSILPFMRQISMNWSADYLNTPWKMIGMGASGSRIRAGVDGHAIAVDAIRNGLNMRQIEKTTFTLADSALRDWGPASQGVFGLEDSSFGRFLQSIDKTDPMAGQARESLSRIGGALSDSLGAAIHLDKTINAHGMFQFIEDGQLAGYLYRVHDLATSHPDLLKIPDLGQRLKAAKALAADTSNRLSGALPMALVSNPVKAAMFKYGLTPSWWLAKAATLVDTVDSMTYFASKGLKLGDKGFVEALAGRKAFDHLPESVRDTARARMVKMMGGMLFASYMGLQATQWMYNQTFTTDHPPDKIFHLQHGGMYYNSPLTYGMVKDLVKFSSDSLKSQSSLNPSDFNPSAFVGDVTVAAMRQLENLLILDPAELLDIGNKSSTSNTDVADRIFNMGDYIAKTMTPLHDLAGWGKDAKASEMVGLRGDLSSSDKAARTLSGQEYLGRQAGLYDSKANVENSKLGELHHKEQDILNEHRRNIQVFLDKARLAKSSAEQLHWLNEARVSWAKRVEVKDPVMQRYYGPRHGVSDRVFQGMVSEAITPAYAAANRGKLLMNPEVTRAIEKDESMGE